MAKYGTFMSPDLFGSKFFMGTVVKKYNENPLHFLMGEYETEGNLKLISVALCSSGFKCIHRKCKTRSTVINLLEDRHLKDFRDMGWNFEVLVSGKPEFVLKSEVCSE